MTETLWTQSLKRKSNFAATRSRGAMRCPADVRKAAAEAIAAREFPLPIAPGTIVSGFMPMKSEINPLPLMKTLAEAGATLALPKIAGRGKPLVMRAWPWGGPLEAGQWGIREPKPMRRKSSPTSYWCRSLPSTARAAHRLWRRLLRHDHCALAFAQNRHRRRHRLCDQEVSTVPATDRDARLDLVLTEREVIAIKG